MKKQKIQESIENKSSACKTQMHLDQLELQARNQHIIDEKNSQQNHKLCFTMYSPHCHAYINA